MTLLSQKQRCYAYDIDVYAKIITKSPHSIIYFMLLQSQLMISWQYRSVDGILSQKKCCYTYNMDVYAKICVSLANIF